MTSGWSLKVNPPLEEAVAVVGAVTAAAAAAAASEGADIVGAGGEVAWRDLGVRRRGRCDCDGDGKDALGVGLGRFCARGAACLPACVREREREREAMWAFACVACWARIGYLGLLACVALGGREVQWFRWAVTEV